MFDFFRDIALELSGVDSKGAEQQRKDKLDEKRKDRFIFSKGAKVLVYIFGVLYLVAGATTISLAKTSGALNALMILRFIALTLLDVSSVVCLAIGKKKTEIVALILIVLFVLIQYFTTVFVGA